MLENKDCVMFKDMSAKEQGTIIQALKDGLEVEHCYTKNTGWFKVVCKRTLNLDWAYRVIPKRLNIPWFSIRDDLCYAVMMESKSVWITDKKPFWRDDLDSWWWEDSEAIDLNCLNIDTDGIDFRTSLVSRFD